MLPPFFYARLSTEHDREREHSGVFKMDRKRSQPRVRNCVGQLGGGSAGSALFLFTSLVLWAVSKTVKMVWS